MTDTADYKKPRAPKGLATGGKKLWTQMHDEFSFQGEPQKLAVLERSCRTVDRIEQLDDAMVDQPLQVRGSQGQMVINPLISESRQQAALLATLLGKLGLPDADLEVAQRQMKRTASAKNAAQVRWGL